MNEAQMSKIVLSTVRKEAGNEYLHGPNICLRRICIEEYIRQVSDKNT